VSIVRTDTCLDPAPLALPSLSGSSLDVDLGPEFRLKTSLQARQRAFHPAAALAQHMRVALGRSDGASTGGGVGGQL
jgi:hypothetical protein